jgi:hypothetical protein
LQPREANAKKKSSTCEEEEEEEAGSIGTNNGNDTAECSAMQCKEQCMHAAKHGNKEQRRRRRRRRAFHRPLLTIGPSIPSLSSSVD